MKVISIMKKIICAPALALSLLLAAPAHAYDGLSSELAHTAAGALLAAAVTRASEDSPNRAWVGFAASTATAVLVEGYNISRGSDRSGQLLDIFSHTLGAAIGAWATDRYFLAPVITPRGVGLALTRSF